MTTAGSISFSIEGFDELVKALAKFPDDAAEVMASSVMQGALIVQDDAKVRCPVDTGTLKRSIHSEFEEQTPNSASAVVGTDVEYGKYVEFGTSRMSAQPYLRPAVDENREAIEKAITDSFVELAYQELQNRGPRGGLRR